MESVKNVVNTVVNDPKLFKEARYLLVPSLPLDLGSVSLAYSNSEPKIYMTKMVGQEGCIDWNISSFVSTWKNAIINKEFTPELTSLFQDVTNELMPGFTYEIGTFHWFLRPHCQNTKIGFALFGSRSFNILTSNDPNSLKHLQFLSANIDELIPLSSFVFRRVNTNLDIGDISADIFIMVSSNSNIFLQVCIKCVFNPDKLTKNIINIMSSNLSSKQSKNNNFNPTNLGTSPTGSSSDFPHTKLTNNNNNNDERNSISNMNNNTKVTKNDDNDDKYNNINKCKVDLLHSKSIWEWVTNNKFSLLSISAASLAINVASKGISRGLRVKL